MTGWRLVLMTLGLCTALAVPALADDNQQQSTKAWHSIDDCGRRAFRKYPDYTAESNAKREAFRRLCLRNRGLPAPDAAPPQSR